MTKMQNWLHDIVNDGIAKDVYQAETSLQLFKQILKYSKEIEKSSFAILFDTLRFILTKEFTLAIAKLYEEEGRCYKIRSIPSALKLLEESANELIIVEKPSLIRKMIRCGFDGNYLNSLGDTRITNEIIKYFRNTLQGQKLKAMNALKTARDKVIAHHELIQTNNLPTTNIEEIEQLIAHAERFLGIIGSGYLSIAYEDDDSNCFLSSDAKRASRAIERLLQAAGIIKNSRVGWAPPTDSAL